MLFCASSSSSVALLGALFAGALVVVTFNTIRLQILAQAAEIEVAKLIGATHAFIRRPFQYFGALQGALGGLFAALLVALGGRLLAAPVGELAALYGGEFVLHGLTAANVAVLAASGAVLGWLAPNSRWASTCTASDDPLFLEPAWKLINTHLQTSIFLKDNMQIVSGNSLQRARAAFWTWTEHWSTRQFPSSACGQGGKPRRFFRQSRAPHARSSRSRHHDLVPPGVDPEVEVEIVNHTSWSTPTASSPSAVPPNCSPRYRLAAGRW